MSASLHDIAATFRASLPKALDLSVVRIDALDRTGVPVVQSNLLQPGKPVTTGHGYGFEAIEAEVGALGELCEEVHGAAALAHAPTKHGSYNDLLRQHGEHGVLDPLTLCLPAGSSYTPDMPLAWLLGRRWPSHEPVLIPDEWVASHGYDLEQRAGLITPITNGLGAGLDLEHAIAHGVMELLQRDGNVVDYRALDRGTVVEMDDIPDPQVANLLAHLRDLGIDVTIKLATTEFGIANLYVVGDDRGNPALPIQVTACGEAAHPDRNRALRKALLEFCGSRVRKAATHGPIDTCRTVMSQAHIDRQIAAVRLDEEEPRALAAMAEWLDQDATELRARLSNSVFRRTDSVRFSDLPNASPDQVTNSTDRLELLADRLSAQHIDIVYVDCSPEGSPVRAVKVVVPFLESEAMSYGRIGWRVADRLRRRNDPLLLDTPREGAHRIRLRPSDEDRAGGAAWFDAVRAERLVGTLYPLYREPGCFSAQLQRRAPKGAAA
jgi:ribosomal protein S12 methylthiotransferase accessory factor